MTEHSLPAALAAALATKGYSSLTSVQEAVLVAEAAGRDLLVSAQTGSGKTVAFGLAIAPEVMDGTDRLLFAAEPLALIVAPTRELALQVRREFEWLYADAGATIASCVGGMDFRNERRTLERGAHIVVGTPGRLRDHIERGSLNLSAIRAVVLDEADEMLDLGFREDLEFILSAMPEGKRTLMFSATVPAEIAELATTFQTDALRVVAQGEARQHVDIEYRAYSVAPRDKEHAIFNILRFHEARTAIVFAKTRANVNHLFARMGNRGFQVVALSGELSQAERSHALQALRDGRARVCIATDVAARGIDLPGLELVIHADLPGSSETLLHRSGRTGRAGSKGVSALVVTPAEFKKAHRLLQGAKVVAEWGAPPSADDVLARDEVRMMEDPALAEGPGEELELNAKLIERFGAETLAGAFVRMWRAGRSAPEEIGEVSTPAAPAAPRPRGEFGEAVWYELNVGHTGRAEARWLLPKICDAGGIAKDGIGAIRVQQDRSFVQISAPLAGRFGETTDIDTGLTMTRLAGEPDFGPARGAPRAPSKYTPRPPREEGEYRPRAAEGASERTERKTYTPRPLREEDGEGRKPYAPRPKRDDDGERRSYTPREDGERKPYAPRPKRDDGDAPRKPYAPRPAREEGGERKPWTPRPKDDDAPRKPYAARSDDAPRKSYGARSDDAPRKPYTPRPTQDGDAPRKPRWKDGDRPEGDKRLARSEGFKSHSDKPAGKSWGDKPAKGAPKSAGFKSHGGAAKSTGFKSHGSKSAKPGGSDVPSRKPAAPKTDARDTSKRFVPPKKPKA
ncbi:DEAD/DEAH box helicase [Neotabrizicola shimadae]|uniref:DEAD/DEAH box helicase n=1 Tax=Neotabrizicola shimadae TaxID=2807096 RepID=A0A8G1EBL8_9RHOB|nr:DEAD/DEAH box helicase [Neotabrizicola shimadae]QYZ69760.1 DEAD/DEAH box helicase [Neotabrizicola shimadae]